MQASTAARNSIYYMRVIDGWLHLELPGIEIPQSSIIYDSGGRIIKGVPAKSHPGRPGGDVTLHY